MFESFAGINQCFVHYLSDVFGAGSYDSCGVLGLAVGGEIGGQDERSVVEAKNIYVEKLETEPETC
jgi:hypothetical protein